MPNSVQNKEGVQNKEVSCKRVLGWLVVMIVALCMSTFLYTLFTTFRNRDEHCARILLLQELMGRDTFVNSPEVTAFSPDYNREIRLFESLNHEEQHTYLNMSREEKFAHYGKLLN